MRYSCAAFRILQKRYVSVLKKCALINAGLFFLAAPAMAEKIVDINEGTHIERFGTLRDNIINGTSDDGILILNLKANTNRRGDPLGEMSSNLTELTLNGENHKLQGNETSVGEDTPITVKNGQTLNINNLTVNYFETFISNTGTEATGNKGGTVNISGSTFSENSSNWGGVIKNNGTLYIENSTFSGNSAETNGGAIDTWGGTTTIKNSTFTNNNGYSNRDSDTAYASSGGAINNNDGGTLNIIADGGNVAFTGNYIGQLIRHIGSDEDYRLSNAIANGGTVNLNAYGENRIIFNDTIAAASGKENHNKVININGVADENGSWQAAENAGTVEINNLVTGNPTNSQDKQTVNLYGGTLKFGYYDSTENYNYASGIGGFDNSSIIFNVHGGTLSTQDGVGRYTTNLNEVQNTTTLGAVNLQSDLKLAIDAIQNGDGRGEQGYGADMFSVASFNANGHKVLLTDIDLGNNSTYDGKAVSPNSTDWAGIELDENAVLQSDTTDFSKTNHLLAWNKNTGILKVGAYTLQEAVAETAGDRVYNMNTEENVTAGLGEMLDTGTLVINGNDNNITATGDGDLSNLPAGITVGTDDTLTINDVANMSGFATALNITGGETTVNNSTLSENDTALNVASGASVTLNDTDIKNNLANGIINAGTVNLNATAGASAENKNTVTVNNPLDDTQPGTLENTGTLNLNAFANAIIDIKDVIKGNATPTGTVPGTVNINQDTDATGEVKLADIENQTVNIAKGMVTAGAISGSDVNITAGNVTAGNIAGSTVDIADGSLELGAVSEQSVITAEAATDSLTIASVDGSTVTTSATKTEITGAVNASTVTTSGNTDISGAISNGSTITANAGTLDITNTVTGSTVTSKGKTTIAGAISGESTVDVQGGETTISAAVTGSELKVSGGTLTVANTGSISEASEIFVSDNGNADINSNVDSSEIAVTGGKADFASVTGSRADIDGGETTIASIAKSENGTRSTIEQTAGTLNLGNTVTNTDITNNGGTLNLGTSEQGISLAGSTIASGTANLLASTITGGANGAFTIDTGVTLTTTQEAEIAASINGTGTISATGNELTFSTTDDATGSDFTGTISATAQTTDGTTKQAIVNLDSSYGLSTDATVSLDNSILNYDTTQTTLSDASLFNIALNNSATANINGADRDTHNIALSDKFWSVKKGSTGAINFNKAHYTLGTGFTTGTDSTATFNNTDISLAGQDENSSFGNIALNDSTLLLSEKGKRNPADSYTFGSLVSDGESNNLHIDVNLGLAAVTDDPKADKIVITGESSGLLNITELFITDDSGMIDEKGKTIQILDIQKKLGESEDHLKLKAEDGLEILSWATNVYEYGVDSATQDTAQDSIKISLDRPSSTDTLRDLNRYNINKGEEYNHNRGFNFIADKNSEDEIANTVGSYNIYRDLDATAAGNFTISGKTHTKDDGTVLKSVLSGVLEDLTISADSERYSELSRPSFGGGMGTVGWETYYQYKDADGNVEIDNISADKVSKENDDITFAVGAMGNDSGDGARGSMFEIVNETNFTIRDVSVEKALRQASDKITDGAAIYASNAAAEVTLENTDFKNNEVKGGNGGAIANIKSAVFNIANALFSGNKASANGGAIYNADKMTINGATFEDNAAQNGGAIYNDTDATMTITAEADEESGKSGLVQFTANATTGADGKGGAIYNAGTLNLKGNITVAAATTDEDGTITASNDIYNAGTLNLNELKAESGENDEDAAGEIKLNSDVTNTAAAALNINNGTVSLSNVTNDGTLNINGGKVILNGAITAALDSDNAATSGALNIKGGFLTLAKSASITQKTMSIGAGVEFTANADSLTITNGITNAGSLTFTGGTNSNTISGTGTTTISGNIKNTGGGITQDAITIADSGSLTTAADKIAINKDVTEKQVTNNGSLTLTTAADTPDATELGYSVVDSDEGAESKLTIVGNIALGDNRINQDLLTINNGALFTANAEKLDIASGSITNNGSLTLDSDKETTLGYSVVDSDEDAESMLTIAGNITLGDNYEINQDLLTINGAFTADAEKLDIASGSITNNGSLTLTGGNNANAINNDGTLIYQTATNETVTNTGAITGSGNLTITIAEKGGFTNSAAIEQNNVTFNGAGTVTNNASVSAATNGTITIGTDITVDNNEKGTLSGNIANAGTINTGTVSGTIANTGTISNATLSGKLDNDGTISGGSVTAAEGSVNDGTISAAVTADGKFTNNNKIEGSVTANRGTFTNAGEINTGDNGKVEIATVAEFANNGTITGNVANSGTLTNNSGATISGEVINSNIFANTGEVLDVTNNAGSTFTNSGTAGNVTNAGTFTNTGTIASLDNEKGATATTALSGIDGDIANAGTLNLTETSLELDKTISGVGTTNLAQNSTLTFGNNAKVEGTLNLNNTTINMQEKQSPYEFDTVNIGSLAGTGSLNIDISLDKGENAAGKSDVINLTSGAGNSGSLTLTSVNVTEDGDADYVSYLTGNTAGLDLKLSNDEQAIATVTNDYAYVFAADGTGKLNVEQVTLDTGKSNTLKDFIEGTLAIEENIDATTYSMTDDITITAEEGTFGSTGTDTASNTLYLNQNGHTLSGTLNGDKHNGITVGTNDTLHVNSTGAGGTVSGFETAFAVEETGTLNIGNTKFEGNTTDIANSGTLNATNIASNNIVNNGTAVFNGSNTLGNVTGTDGQMTIAGQTTATGNIEQNKVTVNTGAGLTANLNGYAVATTENNGALTLNGDGTLGNVSGTGNLSLNGAVEVNSGTSITQEKINLSGTADKLAALTNNGNISSAIIVNENGSVSGEGAMTLWGGSENKGTISQTSIAINGNTVNTGEISGNSLSVAENVLVTNTGGVLSGNIANAGTINTGTVSGSIANTGTISNATLSGKLDNDGTISGGSVTAEADSSNNGTISLAQGEALLANGNFTNALNAVIKGSVTANSGTFTNAGEINTGSNGGVEIASTAEFANTGTIMGDVANSGKLTNAGGATISGMITNKGTLENLVNGKLYGVINSNTFTNAGEVRDVTNNAGGTFTNTGTAGNVTNADTFENTGTAGNVTNTGTFTNTGTIASLDNEKGATATTALSGITGNIANDGILNLTDAEATLDKTIGGAGTTSISGAVTFGENGGFAATQSLHVNEEAMLDIAANTITLDNFTLKGQLNLAITDISANSSEYEGGKILVNSANLEEGSKMQFTVGKGLLSGKQQTGELAIIDLKDGATGTIEGDLSDMFYDNNLYEISQGETAGTVIITNVATAQEVITGIGNQNQINTAGAWENTVVEEDSLHGSIQNKLNTLVQHDIPQYLEALTNLAPTDSQFRLQNAKEAQNLIGRQIALRLDSSDCPTCKDPFRKTAMWMQGLGGYAKQDNRFDAAGYSAYTGGYAIGYDGNVNCDTTVGFGYAYTTTDGESHGRDMDVSAHNLFAYGKYQPSAWYLRGAFTYGAAKYDEKSDVAGHSVTAKYDVHYTGLEAALGHDFANGLTPEFGLRATHLMPDDYEDSLGQKVTNKDVFALSAAALLKYRNTYELNEYTVRPNVYAGLTYDLTDDGSNTAVRINEMNYDIIGKRLPRLGGEAGFAVEVSHDNIDLSVGYDLGYREDYISHTGMIKLRYNFN